MYRDLATCVRFRTSGESSAEPDGARCRGHASSVRQTPGGGQFTEGGCFAGPERNSKGAVVTKIQRAIVAVAAAGGLAWASVASAQLAFTNLNPDPKASNAAFPLQNLNGPSGTNYQVNYPYPGQCLASSANRALFPHPPPVRRPGLEQLQVRGPDARREPALGGRLGRLWRALGVPLHHSRTGRAESREQVPVGGAESSRLHAGQHHHAWHGRHLPRRRLLRDRPARGERLPGAGRGRPLPDPPANKPVPSGMQWTGLTCNIVGGCSCPPDASASFRATYCTNAAGKIPRGAPLFTPIWGVGQINMGGGPVTQVLSGAGLFAAGPASPWSANNYVATWPSISIRGTTGTPVVVKWVNEFPNTHVLCPHPEAADWPCAIDRTFMGVKSKIDHALAGPAGTVPPDGVNQYGSPQQPDNSWVTHLHGGEIPPSTDGFADEVGRQRGHRPEVRPGRPELRDAPVREPVQHRPQASARQRRRLHVPDDPGRGDHLVPRPHHRQDPPQRDRGPGRFLPGEGPEQARVGSRLAQVDR